MKRVFTVIVILLMTEVYAQTVYVPSGISGIVPSDIPANGNVGIGVSDPTTKLQVKGGAFQQINVDNNSGIYLDATATSEPKIGWRVSDNSERFRIHFQGLNTSTERLAFYKNLGGEREVLSVLSNGNVGIGTNTPGRALDVAGDATANNFYLRNAWNGAKISGNGETVEYLSSWYHSFNSITNSVPTLFLNARSGNVGIGTTSPSTKLQITGGAFQQINVDNNSGIYLDATATSEPKIGWRVSDNSERFRIHFQGINTSTERLAFYKTLGGEREVLSVLSNGSVGIGTTTPGTFKLAVAGKIWGQEVQVALTNPGPDYVFEPTYTLPSLDSVQLYINQNKHLPEVPSAKEMETNGVNLGEMNMLLLKKVEELTLYMIEQQNEIRALKVEVKILKSVSDK